MVRNLCLGMLCAVTAMSCAQNPVAGNEHLYYGIDTANKIIVCHEEVLSAITEGNDLVFGSSKYQLVSPLSGFSSQERYVVMKEKDTFSLYITSMPIIKLTASDTIVDEPKRMAHFSFASASESYDGAIGIELRGNSALRYPKKSYDLELRKDATSEESVDFTFGDLREDDDWILNSIYNEPLKLRSYFSTKLWLDLYAPSYLDKEPDAKSYSDVMFAEVFLNDTYEGLYLLSEQVDRKLLDLKKSKGDTVRGELFKAVGYADNTSFKGVSEFNNAFPRWEGFEVKYPYEDYVAHYDNLHAFITFVSTSTDEEFTENIEAYLDVDNAIDYFLFINLLRGTDNISKNYFLAKYKQNEPYFFVPWDLDGVLGIIQDGKRIPTTNDILTNALFDRLYATNAAGYKTKLKERWQTLRNGVYGDKALHERIDKTYRLLDDTKLYQRDALMWERVHTITADYKYLTEWLQQRLLYLDTVFIDY
ncbi:CotH kinase family protein [Jejudonia soesokkakensis]|uniref:CotH kinase family protein n=1 Tax=Jejudonia soesokkakensis TaxID=1323432 RepID=A0ABW2MVT2_9FLAO